MRSAIIKAKDFEIELPIIEGTENEKAIDITSLRSSTGYITLDTGYGNTGSCQSSITYIDGEKGILRYRGYPIEDLVNSGISFTDVSYLLIHGELSESDKKTAFKDYIRTHANIHEDMSGVRMNHADLSRASINDTDFSNARLNSAILRDLQASNTDFSGADLRYTDFTNAFLMNANFEGAQLGQIDFTGANLNGATFSPGVNLGLTSYCYNHQLCN